MYCAVVKLTTLTQNRVNILIKFFFYISFENMEKFEVKKLIFQVGVKIHPTWYLKG